MCPTLAAALRQSACCCVQNMSKFEGIPKVRFGAGAFNKAHNCSFRFLTRR